MQKKHTVLIHESILLNEEIPRDLLFPEWCDLRSVQFAKEILPLSVALSAKAVILDLSHPDFEQIPLKDFLADLQTVNAKREDLPLVAIGVYSPQGRDALPSFFEAGIASALSRPLKARDLQRELSELLSIAFRRLERKQIAVAVELKLGETIFAAQGRDINLECISVAAANLPPIGSNVFLSCSHPGLSRLCLWTYCWKKADDGMVLRFLNPTLELLEAIQNLPKFQPALQDIVARSEPATFHPEEMKAFEPDLLRGWAQTELPSQTGVLNKLSPFERSLVLETQASNEELAFMVLVKIALQLQLNHLLTMGRIPADTLDEIAKTIAHHETFVAPMIKRLQQLLAETLVEGNQTFANALSALKSELQKILVTMRQTLELKGALGTVKATRAASLTLPPPTPDFIPEDDYAPTRYKERAPVTPVKREVVAPERKKELLASVLQISLVTCLIAVLGLIIHYELTAQKRQNRILSSEDLKTLSDYFESGTQHGKKDNTSVQLTLKQEWNRLDNERKLQEIHAVANKFKVLEIHFAEINSAHGSTVAIYMDGQIQYHPTHAR